MDVEVFMSGCLLLYHAKTAKQVWMNFGVKIAYNLDSRIGFFIPENIGEIAGLLL